jgi:hypothetical protein
VDEEDRLAFAVPGFDEMNATAAAPGDDVLLCVILLGAVAGHLLEVWRQVIGGSKGEGVAAGSDGGDAA